MPEDKKHSYIKFYGRDWLGDTMLRMCAPDERGVWIDLLCIMAGAEPYGHIAVNNRIMTDAEVSRVIGMDENTYKGILYRLLEKGIPSKAENGMIYSRRMVREHKKFITGRVSGLKGGGNPALKKEESIIQIPDTISHISEAKGGLKVPYIGQDDSKTDLWSLNEVLEIAASPSVVVGKTMAQECFDHYASQGWMNAAKNPVGRTKGELGALLRKWKTAAPSMRKSLQDIPENETLAEKALRVEKMIRGIK
jgi:hypothetical protein